MANKKIPLKFDVQIYGNLEPYSSTISKARVRIFYRGRNRNWSYISDEFAEKLIATLPYAPIKGIYDENEENFTDHGSGPKALGKAYGVIPERNNGSWERHIDPDGVERIYYCCDVLLWTSLYENAKKIPGKCQSMELYEPSIKGEWKTLEDGFEVYEFTEGCFLGLQVLGTIDGIEVEPCFEGSAFYSLSQNLSEQFSDIIKIAKNYNLKKEDNIMENEKPVLKNQLNEQTIQENTEKTQENGAEFSENTQTENIQTENIQIENTQAENTQAENTQTENTQAENTQTENSEDFTKNENTQSDADLDFEVKYKEATNKIKELEENYAKLLTEKNVLQSNFDHIKSERDKLQEFKNQTETAEKEEILSKYAVALSEETLNSYKEKLSDFTAIELEKELCFEAHKNDTFEPKTSNFSYKGNDTENEHLSKLERYLNKYKTEE